MAVSIWEGNKAQDLIDAVNRTLKVDKQQGVANAGKALIVGSDGLVTLGNAGLSTEAKLALLECLRNVAWTDENGYQSYNKLYKAIFDEEASPVKYWDYKWDASSGIIPTGMVCGVASFEIEPNALFVQAPHFPIDYVGDCEVEVEIKYSAAGTDYSPNMGSFGPQISIVKNISNNNAYVAYVRGYCGNNVTKLCARVDESADLQTTYDQNEYHLINVKLEGGVFTLKVDGNVVDTGVTGRSVASDSNFTGLSYFYSGTTPRAFTFIKSIKFRKITD